MKKLFTMMILVCLICIQVSMSCFAFEELSKGSKGDDVVELQNRLNELGYSVGKADGDYGGKTEKAIRTFQSDNGLEVTGIVDETTFQALFNTSKEDEDNAGKTPFGRNNIENIWLVNNGIRVLTDDGNVWEIIPSQFNHSETTSEIIATDVHSVFDNNGNEDIFIGNDNYARLETGKPHLENNYDLDDEWHDILIASANLYHAVGLRRDSTWVTAGSYADGECDVDDWDNIIAVQTGSHHTVGLKDDGTVVATGINDKG